MFTSEIMIFVLVSFLDLIVSFFCLDSIFPFSPERGTRFWQCSGIDFGVVVNVSRVFLFDFVVNNLVGLEIKPLMATFVLVDGFFVEFEHGVLGFCVQFVEPVAESAVDKLFVFNGPEQVVLLPLSLLELLVPQINLVLHHFRLFLLRVQDFLDERVFGWTGDVHLSLLVLDFSFYVVFHQRWLV